MAHDATDLARCREWFDWYVGRLDHASASRPAQEGVRYACPCCGYLTLEECGSYEICPICFWEDDGQDDADKDSIRGGPNGALSLSQARVNYRRFGACEQRLLPHVRAPHPEEQP